MASTAHIPQGAVIVCPQCDAACRVGSPYYLKNLGRCERCEVAMIDDPHPSRVARRNESYEVAE